MLRANVLESERRVTATNGHRLLFTGDNHDSEACETHDQKILQWRQLAVVINGGYTLKKKIEAHF